MKVQWEKLPAAWKWRMAILVIVILYYLAISYNLSRAIVLGTAYHSLQNEAKIIDDDIKAVGEDSSASVWHASAVHAGNAENSLLKTVADYAANQSINIREMEQYSQNVDSDWSVHTDKIRITGNYQSTLQLLYNLEKDNPDIIINSAQWELGKDKLTSLYVLSAVFYAKHMQHE